MLMEKPMIPFRNSSKCDENFVTWIGSSMLKNKQQANSNVYSCIMG
jgi:hypothetical protein